MRRPRWFTVLLASMVMMVLVVGVVVFANMSGAPVTEQTNPEPTVNDAPGPETTTQPGAEPTDRADPYADAAGEGDPEPVDLGPIQTHDPQQFARAFAAVWMAPSPADYSYQEYVEFILVNFKAHPGNDALSEEGREVIMGQARTEDDWQTMAESATSQQLVITDIGEPGWVETSTGQEIVAEAERISLPGPTYFVEISGHILSSSNDGGDVLGQGRDLFWVWCDDQGCGLADVWTPSLPRSRGSTVRRTLELSGQGLLTL